MQTHEEANAFLQKGRDKHDRALENNTRLVRLDEHSIGVKLHATYVVIYHDDGTITINTGGWHTSTTFNRINAYSPARVGTRRGQTEIRYFDTVQPTRLPWNGTPIQVDAYGRFVKVAR